RCSARSGATVKVLISVTTPLSVLRVVMAQLLMDSCAGPSARRAAGSSRNRPRSRRVCRHARYAARCCTCAGPPSSSLSAGNDRLPGRLRRRSASVQPGDQLAAGPEFDRRVLEVLADRLAASAEMLGQERFGDRVEGAAVLRPAETVAFVGVAD